MTPEEYYADKVILITGGAGAIGSNLCDALCDIGSRLVIVLDDLSASAKWNVPSRSNILFIKGSITDDIMLKRVFNEDPAIVFHLAAFFANQNSIDYPEKDLMVNGLGTLKLLQYARLIRVTKFVYASSGCSIYGSTAPLPLKEEFMSMNLSTPYQVTKMLGELYCNFFYHQYNMPIVKTRFFNSYGPGEMPGQYRNVIPNFIYWALNKQPLPITGTGEETRDFAFVGDIVHGLMLAGAKEQAVGQEMNLASGQETRIIDLARIINDMTANPSEIHFSPKRKWDTKSRLLASIERAQVLLGYAPKTGLKEGLESTISWFNKNWNLIQAHASFPPGISSAVRSISR
jgi:UDP-glucose 4-epimerase